MALLQKKCDHSLYYKAIKELPSLVDLSCHMYKQTQAYEHSGQARVTDVVDTVQHEYAICKNESLETQAHDLSLLERNVIDYRISWVKVLILNQFYTHSLFVLFKGIMVQFNLLYIPNIYILML